MDCSFEHGDHYFRYRVGAIIIQDGCVLMAKNDRDPYYYSVGGAVKMHETSENAVRREVFEETGVHFEIERLIIVHENFFQGFLGDDSLKCHEVALYYLMKPNGAREFSKESFAQGGAKEHVCWLPLDSLCDYEFYPAFFREKLRNMADGVEHIVTLR